jgi:hypothetical protein
VKKINLRGAQAALEIGAEFIVPYHAEGGQDPKNRAIYLLCLNLEGLIRAIQKRGKDVNKKG